MTATDLDALYDEYFEGLVFVRQRVAMGAVVERIIREATRGRDFSILSLPAWLAILAVDSDAIIYAAEWGKRLHCGLLPSVGKHLSIVQKNVGRDRGTADACARLFPAAIGRAVMAVDIHDLVARVRTIVKRLRTTRNVHAHPLGPSALPETNVSHLRSSIVRRTTDELLSIWEDLCLVAFRSIPALIDVGEHWWDAHRVCEPLVDAVLLGADAVRGRVPDRNAAYERLHAALDAGRTRPHFNSHAWLIQ